GSWLCARARRMRLMARCTSAACGSISASISSRRKISTLSIGHLPSSLTVEGCTQGGDSLGRNRTNLVRGSPELAADLVRALVLHVLQSQNHALHFGQLGHRS